VTTQTEPEATPTISHQKVAKNTLIYLLGQIVSWCVTFLTVSIIPRRIGEEGMGQLAVAASITTTVGSCFALGIDSYLVAEIGRCPENSDRLVRSLWAFRCVTMLPQILVTLLVMKVMHVSDLIFYIGCLNLVSMLATKIFTPIRSAFNGWETARAVSIMDFATTLPMLMAIPFLQYGPLGISVISTLWNYVILISSLIAIRAIIRKVPQFDVALWKELIKGGLPFFANGVIMSLFGFSSVFVLRHYMNDAAVGEYNQVTRLGGTFLFLPVAIGTAMLPSLARLADVNPGDFRRMQSRVLSLMIAMGLPVATLIFLLAFPFSRLLYGQGKFLAVPVLLQLYAFMIIPLYINTTIYRFLIAQKKNAVWSGFLAGTVLMHVTFSFLLTPLALRWTKFGQLGVLASNILAEVITVFFAFILLRTNPLNRETVGKILRSLLATALTAGVIWVTRSLFIVIPALLGLATYLVSAYYLKVLGEEDQRKVVDIFREKFRRRKA
jgi:O-antigen/teichoic acid export membrane protein